MRTIYEDRGGHLWFGTSGGVSRFDGSTWASYTIDEGLVWDGVRSIVQDNEGVMWFGTEQGLSRFDGETWTTYTAERDGLANNFVNRTLVDRQGRLWIGTNGGVSLYDSGVFTTYSEHDGLSENRVLSIAEDMNGNLWFGTQGGGASRYEETWMTFGQRDGLPNPNLWRIFHDRDGRLWLGGHRGGRGLGMYDGERFWNYRSEHPDDFFTKPYKSSFFIDRDGRMWIGSWREGAIRLDGDIATAVDPGDGLGNPWVGDIAQDSAGRIWFGTLSGATRYDGRQYVSYGKEDGLAAGGVRSVYEDRWGHMWFHSMTGISRFDGSHWTTFPHGGGWSNFLEDDSGSLWTGVPEGALRFMDGDWTLLTPQTGLAGGGVRWIIQDKQGHHWFATGGGGVTRYDGEVYQTVVKGNGLPSNHVRCISEDPDGNLWFATNNGLTKFTQPLPSPPPVFVDAVVADRRYEGVSVLRVPSSSEIVAFEFHGVSFRIGRDGLIYQYRLLGSHDDWRTTVIGRVEYEGLGRGDYTFEVRAVDRDLVYSKSPAAVVLSIHMPYMQMGLWSGLGIAIVLVGWQTARVVRRDRRLRQSNEALSDANNELFQVNVDLQREQVLERLRGQAQGMQSSGDIAGIAASMFQEVENLGIPISRSTVALFHEEKGEYEYWFNTADGHPSEPVSQAIDPILTNHPAYQAWKAQERHLHIHRTRQEIEETTRDAARRGNPLPELEGVPEEEWPEKMDFYWFFFPQGSLKLNLFEAMSEDDLRIMERFADTFGFAYSRHQELKQKEAQNRRLAVDASVQRLRAEVQSMNEASDFEHILSLLTESLTTVELTFDGCEIDVLDEPIENPTMAHFEANGFRYTTFRLDPEGNVAPRLYNVAAPFPTVIEQTIERFIADEPWQAVVAEDTTILEVPAGSYGRLRLTASGGERFNEDEVATLREFADAVALGYARYLDIREIQLNTERKSEFLASMSHELRTPMNAIKGFTNLVLRREKTLSDRGQENLQKATQASDRLLAMIDDLMDLSKIEAGRMDVNAERFDVRELVTSACDTVSPLIQEGVALRQDVADDIGEANTDKARLQQMVINLLSNAIKFTDSGSVTVTASRGQGAGSGGEELVIAVSDTGKGIPADELPTIFDEYRQAERSESSVQKGTGLGLSITKKFAELLGGTIGLESEVGEGSTFTVRVPMEYQELG